VLLTSPQNILTNLPQSDTVTSATVLNQSKQGRMKSKMVKLNDEEMVQDDQDLTIPRPSYMVHTPPPSKINYRSHDQDALSPATTFDSTLSPSPTRSTTFDDSEAPTQHTISINHNVKTTKGRGGSVARGGAGLIFGMSKPFLLLGIVALLLTGSTGYLFRSWMKLPGLNTQIEQLEEQVAKLNSEIDRLSSQVDRLELENNRYESLNGQLNATVDELVHVKDDLNATSSQLEWTAGRLNETNQELEDRIEELVDENTEYKQLNDQLNETTTTLTGQVSLFRATLARMTLENQGLKNLTSALEEVAASLGNLTQEQNATLLQFQTTLTDFQEENSRLESNNEDLRTLVSFLNETSSGLGQNLDAITAFLANQIVTNQVLVLNSLENTYRQRVATWDCDYRDIFQGEAFVQDFTRVISATNFDTLILPYLEQRVLSELCLDTSDFDAYVQATTPPSSSTTDSLTPLTSTRLLRSVLQYTSSALDYYFPESTEAGLSTEEWATASFDCENLERRFEWGVSNRAT
jgi:predicted  nucleic acid-binding Zn-ribbon protein